MSMMPETPSASFDPDAYLLKRKEEYRHFLGEAKFAELWSNPPPGLSPFQAVLEAYCAAQHHQAEVQYQVSMFKLTAERRLHLIAGAHAAN